MQRIRSKLNYPNVVSTVCLFLLIGGGTAYAASELAKESVDTKQLAKGAVTPAKLSKGSKKTLTGPRGATGPTGATGLQGPKGDRGETGAPGGFSTTLPSGKTLKGYVAVTGVATGAGERAEDDISFAVPLASAPTPHILEVGAPTTPQCPGSPNKPEAAPGNLCIYEFQHTNARTVATEGDCIYADSSCGVATAFGGIDYVESAGPGNFYVEGSWAVTAP